MPAVYLDSSAIVKLVVEEPESRALRKYLQRKRPVMSSALARAEVVRAVLAEGETAVARARLVLARLDLIRLTDRVLDAAGMLQPPELRSLDSIHLATARLLGDDLAAVVTYDDRMLQAAQRLGMRTVCPA